jgi:hypothetical protein
MVFSIEIGWDKGTFDDRPAPARELPGAQDDPEFVFLVQPQP